MTLRKSNPYRPAPLHAAVLACLATCLALPVHAATSFPDYPLQTGGGSLPPNIMFILDDSGSMAWGFMPGAQSRDESALNNVTSPAKIGLKTYVHNKLYYNPASTYLPWMKADGTRYTGGTTLDAVYTDNALLNDTDDITDSTNEFYVPKAGTTDFANSANYDRYFIARYANVLHVVKDTGSQVLVNDNNRDIAGGKTHDFSITVPANTLRLNVSTSGGSGNVTLQLRQGSTVLCSSANNNSNNESCVQDQPAAGTYTVRLLAPTSGWNNSIDNVDTYVSVATGPFETPTGRSEEAEIANYATWYSYHRTRSKVAKAGASEAFGTLGDKFRVGYDSIWNRHGSTTITGNLPALPIPVGTNDGLFSGANKETWFEYLHTANANSGTPLHGALKRAGDYYETQTGKDGPWGPEETTDTQLSCRQSYAILTTDGYWNQGDDGFELVLGKDERGDDNDIPPTPVVGNVDGTDGLLITSANGKETFTYKPAAPYSDTAADTLADVAMYYWKRDLRTDLPNNVFKSTQNRAFWQHMSTFGISIGLQGTLNPDTDVTLIEAGTKSWPNPWLRSGSTTRDWGNESNYRIDDLLHAAVNGRGSFVAATNPDAFTQALKTTLEAIKSRKASGSNVATNGAQLNTGSTLYQATYTSGEWSGDVLAYSLVGGTRATNPTWSLMKVAGDNATTFRNRGVFTWDTEAQPQGGRTFPTGGQQTALTRTTGDSPVDGDDNADYLKGTTTLEGRGVGKLRERAGLIGDIVNSSPFYVKDINSLFIGANDGMLHAINAVDGSVRFSYVPAGLDFANLATFSDPEYEHRFFVDGGIDVTTLAQGNDKHILVGSLGRGGRGVFALDVTTPASFKASNVLWDQTFSNSNATVADSDMGYVLGAPLVRKGNNGKTLAMVGNGIDSDDGSAVLFIYVMAADGTLADTIKLDTGVGDGNGLAEPRAADLDNDGDADYVYAGDLKGNLWKFDLTDTDPDNWEIANEAKPMFTALDPSNNSQPITAAVALGREPQTTEIFVAFGTGKYITNDDATGSDPQVQTIYSLIDRNEVIGGRSDLEERTIPYWGKDAKGRDARAWEKYSPLPAGVDGWYMDLGVPSPAADGERVVTAPFLRQRALWFSSMIPKPGTDCDSTGTGYLNAIDMFTGTNPQSNGTTTGFIDVNNNGKGGDDTLTDANGGGGDDPGEGDGIVGSIDTGVGMPGQGEFVGEKIFLCGSNTNCAEEPVPPPSGAAKRLNWRELFNRD